MPARIEKRAQRAVPIAHEDDALADDIDDAKRVCRDVLLATNAEPAATKDPLALQRKHGRIAVVRARQRARHRPRSSLGGAPWTLARRGSLCIRHARIIRAR